MMIMFPIGLDMLLFSKYMGIYFKRKFNTNLHYFLILILSMTIQSMANYLQGQLVPQLILYIASFPIVYFLFDGDFLHQLYRWTQITGLTIFLSISIVLFLFVGNKESNRLEIILFFLFYSLTRIILSARICRLDHKKKIQYIDFREYKGLTVQLSFVIVLMVLFIYFIVNLFANGNAPIKNNFASLFTLLFLSISLLIIHIFYTVINIANKLTKEKIINFEHRVEVEYTKTLNKKIDTLHKLRHDLKDQFIMIDYYLNTNEYEKLKDYVSKLQYSISNETMIDIPKHGDLSAFINSKVAIAYENKIKTDIDCNLSELKEPLKIDSVDMVSLISNLFNNAIQALKQVDLNKRELRCSIKYKNDFLLIDMVNRYNPEMIEFKNGRLKTTKKDFHNHGYGIQIIRDIVHTYDGVYDCGIEDDFLKTSITLHNKKEPTI